MAQSIDNKIDQIMTTLKQPDRKCKSFLLLAFVASLFLFTSCLTVDHDLEEAASIIQENEEDSAEIDYTTIKEIRSIYADSGQEELKITEPLHLKGIVISDRAGKNSPAQKEGFLQDKAGDGINFRVSQSSHSFDMGDELSINLEGATILIYRGVLQINFSSKDAKVIAANVAVVPRVLTIKEIQDGKFDATLVKLKDVQFRDYKGLFYYETGLGTNRIIEDCSAANIIVRTTKYASFINETLPAGKGDIVGIVSLNDETWHLIIRNLDDVKEMSNDEATRYSAITPPVEENKNTATDLFFSEYIKGKSYNKYLEIFNGTGTAVDLSDYKVDTYINGQNTAKYSVPLSGILEDGDVVVLQHTKATIYDGVTIESNAINFNGNDAIALVKISTDSFVDIFGRIGEDPGKAWITSTPLNLDLTTLDATLVRKPSVRGGVTVNPKKGFPTLSTGWIMYPVDTADYLGSHTME